VAKDFGIHPWEWDELPVSERTRLIAFARDHAELEYIQTMPSDERKSLRGATEWAYVEE
jgi:hypothetical protein